MFDVSSRAKLSVSALAERKIASARPRKYGLLLRAEEEMLLYGQALATFRRKIGALGRVVKGAQQRKTRRERPAGVLQSLMVRAGGFTG
jgi:hypothetical protein